MARWFLLLAMVLLTGPVLAEGLTPDVPKGKGEACVRDTQFMRNNHMELLLHQRDLTMRQGIRPEKERLGACLDCHAVTDSHGKAVSYDSPQHFCRTCHDYAAVRVDCFECHSSVPETEAAVRGTK